VRALSTVLIVAGALLLADGAATLLWKEPATSVYTHVQQRRLEDQLAVLDRVARRPSTPPAGRRAAEPPDLRAAARAARRRAREGHAVGRLVARDAGIDAVVAEGTAAPDLRKGPGHYVETPLPGARGTVAIAGHRTTYGAPFRHVDRLEHGDRIVLRMPYGRFDYVVERTRIVAPSATWVTRRVTYDRLVLTACHPLYSAAQRIVVFARLVRTRTS
jgi:sortase A